MLRLYDVFYAVSLFIRLIRGAIFLYCVLSWFRPAFRAFDLLGRFIQPFLAPFQRLSMYVMRRFRAPVDFSCLFALLGYGLLERLWVQLYLLLARAL